MSQILTLIWVDIRYYAWPYTKLLLYFVVFSILIAILEVNLQVIMMYILLPFFLMIPFLGPTIVLAQKWNGSFELLCSLPTEASTHAAAKIIFSSIYVVPNAIVGGLILSANGHIIQHGSLAFIEIVAIVLILWLGFSSLCAMEMAIFINFDPNDIFGAPLRILILLLALGAIAVRFGGAGIAAPVRRILAHPPSLGSIILIIALASVLLTFTAFFLARTGFKRFRPLVTSKG